MNILTRFAGAVLLLAAGSSLAAPSGDPNRKELLDEIFAPETFGVTLKHFSVIDGATLILDPTCVFPPGEEPGPGTRCITLNPAPALTGFFEAEIASKTYPANTFKNHICPYFLNIINFELANHTGAPHSDARISLAPFLTFESEAFLDPALIDPATGLPANGKILIAGWGRRMISRSLDDGERHGESFSYTRACNAGLSKAQLIGITGFPAKVIDEMFRKPLTIHVGILGNARLAEFAAMIVAVRMMGH